MNKIFKQTLLATAGLGLVATAQADITMIIVSWGGAYTKSQQRAYHEPYMANNPGVTIVNDDSSSEGASKLRAQAEAGNVTWDLLDAEAPNAITLCDEGLVEEIDFDKDLAPAPDGTSATEDFGKSLISDCFIPQIAYSTTLGFRSDIYDVEPTKMSDVFDLKKFPGKRSLEKRPDPNLEWALIADGVDPKDVYKVLDTPEGVDRAFAKLDTIKDQVIWWTKGSQPMQLLADGEVAFGSAYNGRLFEAIEVNKQPIKMLWDGQALQLDGWVVPKGAPHKAEVMKYLRFATDTQRLADQAKYISYGPLRASSAPLVGKHADLGIDMAPHMPTAPQNMAGAIFYDFEWWADNKDDLAERFESWLAKN
ncbi:MAG: putative spermidine/putrescine transport system substrate-binding protein [Planctomycetota bacterium]|jgi:putative spermidine/putrescine transport system substrate-binding protein